MCTRYDSPLGTMLLAATDRGLAGVWFEGQRHRPDSSGWREDADHPLLREASRSCAPISPASARTSSCRWTCRPARRSSKRVEALLAIPRGATTSYAQLARQLGRPQAPRAVGAAVGRNPVSIVVPCHRVLGSRARSRAMPAAWSARPRCCGWKAR